MKNKHQLATCPYCECRFCKECSDADDQERYCSQECQDDYEAEQDSGTTYVPYGERYVRQ